MRVLFCHDGPLRKDEKNEFYGTAHNDETLKRYYSIAEELAVVIRVQEIMSEEASNRLSKITVNPFEVISCPNISSFKGQLTNKKNAIVIIANEIQKSDYIIARLPSFVGNIAVDIAKKYEKPYLVEVVACPWDGFWNHSITGKFIAPLMYFATKKKVKNAPYVVYVTNEYLQNKYPTDGEYTNCSNVALTEFDDGVLEKRISKIESMKDTDKMVIGTTAAVNVRYKGQQYVIEAIGKLKKQGITNFEYQLVGGGNQTYLKSVAEKYDVVDQVKFLGAMPHSKVFEWLEDIDVYCQPSNTEGLPRALIEAMSRGCPALGSNAGGIPELLDEKFIFKKGSEGDIYTILAYLNKSMMIDQALRNFKESKSYNTDTINTRRKRFFEKFRMDSETKQGLERNK